MRKTKRMMAVALSATMVLASSLTAFAEGPLGTGNTEGAGSSEGHVEKEEVNVVLPTIPSGSTPFAYTMDPERLIQETSAAKYAVGTIFPDEDDDTGVYFLTGDNTYGNASNTLQVINKSSCAIALTVDVQATNVPDKTNIALDSKANVKTATGAPKLYLGLKVGNSTQDVSTTKGTVKKVIAGVPENFEIAVDENDEYVYQESANATTWKAMNIQMEGEVTNLALADADVQAPTVTVTWSYDKATTDDGDAATDAVDYSTTPAAPTEASASASSVAVGGNVDILLPEGVTISQIQKTKADGTYNTLPETYYTLDDITNGKKLTISDNLLTQLPAATKIKVVLSEGDPILINVTAN